MLAVAQALAGGNNTVIVSTAGIIGTMLASDPGLATLPVSIMVCGIWFGTLPLGYLARTAGRRFALQVGIVVGTLAGLVCCVAVIEGSFLLFWSAPSAAAFTPPRTTPIGSLRPTPRGALSIGGRQIEALPAPIDCVPAIVKAVNKRATILFYSGVRSGTDVARALALGADAALRRQGLPVGSRVRSGQGPGHVIDLLIHELRSALGQVGALSPAEARNVMVRHPGALHF